MQKKLKIIPTILQEQYNSLVSNNLEHEFQKLHDAEISTEHFSFYTSVSSVFSSKIEGEEIELDSYIKHKKFGIELKTKSAPMPRYKHNSSFNYLVGV
jgi:hypothetical protein